MKKLFLLISVATALSACVNGLPKRNDYSSDLCGNVAGYTISYIAYGEGKMVMIPLSKVRAESVFVVKLQPLDGFEDADVTVTGTSAKAQPWLTGVTGRYEDLPRTIYPKGSLEVGCVPADPVDTEYKFEVKVKKDDVTNILDPRARVVN